MNDSDVLFKKSILALHRSHRITRFPSSFANASFLNALPADTVNILTQDYTSRMGT